MEPFILDRNFNKTHIIDEFGSIIWTERYYGDDEVELVVPATQEMYQKIPLGAFLGLDGSDRIMILESLKLEHGDLKFTGISLLNWMNNRFIRTSALHEDRYWYLEGTPGWILWAIIYYMCVGSSPYLDGTIPTGIVNPQRFAIPGLHLRDYDQTGAVIKVGIPFGPMYDAMKEIATTYEIGMQIILDKTSPNYLQFRSYKGLDRTSAQSVYSKVRFSPQMDSFANISEIQSQADHKTDVFAFAPGNPDGLATGVAPGVSTETSAYSGFDLRALLVFADDITTDQVGGSSANLVSLLNNRALDERTNRKFVKAVDGEIVPDNQFQYGIHYNMGDVIEVQGNTGVVQDARITEYIRSQDSTGEKSYPTVEML